MRKNQLRYLSVSILLTLAKATFAAGLTSYIGMGLGNTTAEVNSAAGQVASSGAGYRLIAGSQINPVLSVEAEYVDLGTFADATANVAAKGLAMSGVLTMPVMGVLSAYGKAGLARMETIVSPLAGSSTTTASSDTVVAVSFGYGLQLDIAPNASLRLSWDRYKSSTLAGTFTDRIDMNSSASLIYRF